MKNAKQYTLVAVDANGKVTAETSVMEVLTERIAKARQDLGDEKVFVFSGAPLDVTLKTVATIGAKKPRAAKKPTTTKIEPADVLAAIKATDGKTVQIATVLKCDPRDLAAPLTALVEAGTVVRTGKAKGTTYAAKANGA